MVMTTSIEMPLTLHPLLRKPEDKIFKCKFTRNEELGALTHIRKNDVLKNA